MKYDCKIEIENNISLIVLSNAPSDLCFMSSVFSAMAENSIVIDMISQTPPQGITAALSFTISDDDLGKALEVISKLREVYQDIKSSVSSNNSKILISSPDMPKVTGIAAKIFKATAKIHADIRLITTSDIDISLLVPEAMEHDICFAVDDSLK